MSRRCNLPAARDAALDQRRIGAVEVDEGPASVASELDVSRSLQCQASLPVRLAFL